MTDRWNDPPYLLLEWTPDVTTTELLEAARDLAAKFNTPVLMQFQKQASTVSVVPDRVCDVVVTLRVNEDEPAPLKCVLIKGRTA